MKASRFLLLMCSVIVIVGLIFLIQQTSVMGQEGHAREEYVIRKPPASMDKYYPPEAEGPQYLFAMMKMDAPLLGFMTHVQDGDMAKAQEYFKNFATEYRALSKMVPEWGHYWPEEPLDAVSAALGSGDPAKVGPAMGGLMQACSTCHHDNMAAVWARYGKPVSDMGEFMFPIVGAMGAVRTYVSEGEFEKARGAFGLFQERFNELAESCGSCHSSERAYFTGPGVQELLKAAGEALEAEKPNPEQIIGTMNKIGHDSCYECHKVHIPIANIQKAWAGSGGGH